HGATLPLLHAVRSFGLLPDEYDALLLALSVEVDPRFGRIVAYLNDHVARTLPTLGLATALQQERGGGRLSPIEFCERPIVRDGLVELEGEGPLPGLTLRVSRALLPRLMGLSESRVTGDAVRLFPCEPGLLDRLVLEDSLRDSLARWTEARRKGRLLPP